MKGVHRRGFMASAFGASAATGFLVNAAYGAPEGGAIDALKAGARANGHDDDQPALQKLLDRLDESQVVSFPPGRYHLGAPLVVNAARTTLIAYGAIFDHAIVLRGKELRVLGMSVFGSPREGFQFIRGQGGHFEALTATQNQGDGFLIGGAPGAQVAWATFVGCLALQNKNNGWHLVATQPRSWINANVFVGCWSRGNGASGWLSEGKVNYNTWIAPQVEGNGMIAADAVPVDLNGNENFIHGGHVVDSQRKGTAVRLAEGRGSMIFGGRFVGDVQGADFIQARVVNNLQRRLRRAIDRSDDGDE